MGFPAAYEVISLSLSGHNFWAFLVVFLVLLYFSWPPLAFPLGCMVSHFQRCEKVLKFQPYGKCLKFQPCGKCLKFWLCGKCMKLSFMVNL